MTPAACRRQAVSHSQHSDRTSPSDRRGVVSGKKSGAAVSTSRRRVGCVFRRRVVVTSAAHLSLASLSSAAHLRTGRYYRWNIPAVHVPAAGVSRYSSDVAVSVAGVRDSASSSSSWQHDDAFLCSDGSGGAIASHCDVAYSQRPVRDITSRYEHARCDKDAEVRRAACRRLCMVEARYAELMASGILEFARPLCAAAVLSPSDNSTLFQNLEKVWLTCAQQ